MKIVATYDLINGNLFDESDILRKAWEEVSNAIHATDWPHGAGKFSIYPESGKKRGEGNGVKPIKIPCINALRRAGWDIEKLPHLESSVLRTGDLDALKQTTAGYLAFEWETGNIASSHRALNKLFLTMMEADILAGFLVVPVKNLSQYLTDRIGNVEELKPYFPLWRNLTGIKGALRIIAIEHDEINYNVPRIPKGTDGRALE